MLGFDPISLMAASYMLVSSSSNGCPAPTQKPLFDLSVDETPPKVDQTLSAAQITEMKLAGDKAALASGDATAASSATHDAAIRQEMSVEGVSFYNGLTQGQLTGMTQTQISMQIINGQTCLYTDKVMLALRYDPTVYVAAEYTSRPCANKVVTAHENLHVERDLGAIDDFIPRARKSMQEFLDSLGGQGPYEKEEVEGGLTQLRDLIQGDVEQAILPGLSMLRQQYQEGIDTPENYRIQSEMCPASEWAPDIKSGQHVPGIPAEDAAPDAAPEEPPQQ